MDLATLAKALQSQAKANGGIVLNASVLSQADSDAIAAAFALDKGKAFAVSGLQEADIPAPAQGSLSVTKGTTDVFGVKGAAVSLTFTEDNGTLVTTLGVAMPVGWHFKDSFPLDEFPFDSFAPANARFVYASAAQDLPWPGGTPARITLETGLNFLGEVTLDAFPIIGTVLSIAIGTSTFRIAGPFSPVAGQALPVCDLRLQLTSATFDVGVAPNSLSLGPPALAVTIPEATGDIPLQPVLFALEAEFQNTLRVAVGLPATGDMVALSATPLPNMAGIETLIQSLPGGAAFESYVPTPLKTVFQKVGLNDFVMVVSTAKPQKVTYLELAIGGTSAWDIIPGALSLDAFSLDIQSFDPGGEARTEIAVSAQGTFLPAVFADPFDFRLSLEKTKTWEIAQISGHYSGCVRLGDLIAKLPNTSATVPDAIKNIGFSDFGAEATPSASGKGYTYRFSCTTETAFPLLDTTCTATLNLHVSEDPKKGHALDLVGGLAIGEEVFALKIDLRSGSDMVLAQWTQTGEALHFADIADTFGWQDAPVLPEAVNIGLTETTLYYDLKNGTAVLSATTQTKGQVLFASVKPAKGASKDTRVFVLAVDIALDAHLSDLPLIGDKLPDAARLSIDDAMILVSSAALDKDALTDLNEVITGQLKDKAIPGEALTAGLTLAANVDMGGTSKELVVPLSAPDKTTTALAALPGPLAASPPPDYGGAAKWITVGKSFGPVSVERVGLQYQDEALFILLDAALRFSGLDLSLRGLGLGTRLNPIHLEGHLDGLDVAFSAGPVSLSGGLLRVPKSSLPPNVSLEFLGELTISVDPWLISGVGAYASLPDGPSFFAFAEVKGNFGGPPAFFITGFMAGFGYNSSLTLPDADEVYKFPFLAGLDDPSVFGTDPGPMDVLDALTGAGGKPAVVTPVQGEMWIAAGITFTSYELVNGRALVVAEFGHSFEIALLGLAGMSLPQKAASEAYAYVELQLKAVLKPDDGVFSITASLTPRSFLLSKDCVLSGGFAFCLWFDPNAHAGDFVVSIGGYHPAFTPPDWYPVPARVGFNWPVSSAVTAKGGAYFALTPSAIMAGGNLEVVYHSGDVKAWFIAYANFLIRWKPFHYDVSIGISVGVSVSVDLLFTTATLSFELGATIDLWGPPTAGILHVHLYIVSFSVEIGSGQKPTGPQTVDWTGFATLLPPGKATHRKALGATPVAPEVLTLSPASGLQRTTDSGEWIVRADEFGFVARAAIPMTGLDFAGSGTPAQASGGAAPVLPKAIDIRPMGQSGVTAVLTVTLTSLDTGKTEDLAAWTQVLSTSNLPEALWGKPLDDATTPPATAATVQDLPTAVALRAPRATPGASPGAIALDELTDTIARGSRPLDPTTQTDPIPAPVADTKTVQAIANSLAAPASVAAQAALFAALEGLHAAPPSQGPLTRLAAEADAAFTASPLKAA